MTDAARMNESAAIANQGIDALEVNALQSNLQRLFVIRCIVFVLQLAALLYAWKAMHLALDYGLIFTIFFTLTLVNGALYWRLQQHRQPRASELVAHLLIDVLGLSLLLYFTGGASNPFVSYLLVPVTIAAATLSFGYTLALVVCALASYSLLLFFHAPLPALMPDEAAPMHHEAGAGIGLVTDAANLHIWGMWFNFVVSAALITFFVVRMAADNQRQQARLRQYREDTLRNEQILAVATMAAGTAHELGTPLGSMAVVLKDLRQQYAPDKALDDDLKLLQDQVARCRTSLRTLAQKADFRNLQPETLLLSDFLHQLMQQWQLLRPEVACDLSMPPEAAPQIEVEATLQQALINMLNNAADSSPEGLALNVEWSAAQWKLSIRDFGAGISAELAARLGTHFITTKTHGMGVGLVLSQATINRLGGTVNLFALEQGGTLTEITLPLRLPRISKPESQPGQTS